MHRLLVISPQSSVQIPQSPFARLLFYNTRFAWIWLIVRLLIGYQWLTAGWSKLTGYSISFDTFGHASHGGSWIFGKQSGIALTLFVKGALAKTGGTIPIVQGWYATFLQHIVLSHAAYFSYIITFGELLVGLGLIVGAFTGIAASFGVFMNLNYLLAGSISINPPLAIGALFLILAWRISGFYGLDRYLIPLLGTPWTGPLHHVQENGNPANCVEADEEEFGEEFSSIL